VDAFKTLRSVHAVEKARIEYPDGAAFKDDTDLRYEIASGQIRRWIVKGGENSAGGLAVDVSAYVDKVRGWSDIAASIKSLQPASTKVIDRTRIIQRLRGTLSVFLTWQSKGTMNLADILATNQNVGYDSALFGKTSVLKCRTSTLFVLFESQVGEIKKGRGLSPGTQ
jgi:hypothetical protein